MTPIRCTSCGIADATIHGSISVGSSDGGPPVTTEFHRCRACHRIEEEKHAAIPEEQKRFIRSPAFVEALRAELAPVLAAGGPDKLRHDAEFLGLVNTALPYHLPEDLAEFARIHRPLLVVISGLPASGKTTLARQLAPHLNLPVIDKDDILEGLFAQHPRVDADRRRDLSRESDRVLEEQARATARAILVSFWRVAGMPENSGTPTDWFANLTERVVHVHCHCPPDIAAERFVARQRHGAHGDAMRSRDEIEREFISLSKLGAPSIGDVIVVDTSSVVDIDVLVRDIEARIRRYAERRMKIRPLTDADTPAIRELAIAAEAEGFHFLTRFVHEIESGVHAFSSDTACFLGAEAEGDLIALGGVTRDPYVEEPGIGRLRHVYLPPPERRRDTGRALVAALEAAAAPMYHRLRLRTDTEAAARFYESLGYRRVDEPAATHVKTFRC